MKRAIPTIILATLFVLGAHAAPILTLALVPSGGTIAGNSGGVVGWGYDITNNSSANWVVLNDSFVTGSLASGTFGTYLDYIGLDFIVIDPNSSTGTVPFSAGTSGTGEFDIAASVPRNTTIPGGISIDFSVFSQDPNSPTFDPGSFVTSDTVSAPAEADINTPEPASILLTGAGLLSLEWGVRRRRRDRK